MKCPEYKNDWPALWKESFHYDQLEVFGSKVQLSYTYAFRGRFETLMELIQKWLPVNASILDVAAAQGNFTLLLAEAGYKVTWNDLREDLVDYVKLKYEKGEVEFLPGNILEKKGKTYEGVIISEIIEHVAHPDQFLESVAALVKPGGYIFLSTPLGDYLLNNLPRFSDFPNPEIFEKEQFKPNSDGHIFLLYQDELITLAKKKNLDIKELIVQNNFFTTGHLKTRFLYGLLSQQFLKKLEKLTQKLPRKLRLKIHSNISLVLQKPIAEL